MSSLQNAADMSSGKACGGLRERRSVAKRAPSPAIPSDWYVSCIGDTDGIWLDRSLSPAEAWPHRQATVTPSPSGSVTQHGARLCRRTGKAIEHERLRDPSEKAFKGR